MGSSSFSAMSQLKVTSTTRSYLPIMPSTDKTSGENVSISHGIDTVIIFLLLLPTSQELIHWFVLVGVRVQVYKSDVDYGTIMDFP